MNQRDVEKAAEEARWQIRKTGGFDDLLDFTIESYNAKELEEMGFRDPKWLGKYQRGSVDSEEGLTLYINLDTHTNQNDLVDTIRHEIGHGLWELIETKDQRKWLEDVSYDFGPLEAFADDFMWLTVGRKDMMLFKDLFLEVVKPE